MSSTHLRKPIRAVDIPFVPWVYFLVFLGANLLLSYGQLSLEAQLETGFWGIGLPLILGWATRPARTRASQLFWREEFLPDLPAWLWAGVFLAGLFLRLDHLVSLSQWPTPDDGNCLFQALELSQKGIWRILYTFQLHPPLYFWALGLFLKCLPPSLFSLWLFPALFSVAALAAAFWACRALFSRSFAFLFFFLVATGFWPLYIGRFCFNYALAFFGEFLVLACWGFYLRKRGGASPVWPAAVLGICLGLGLFTCIVWVAVVAVLVPFFFFLSRPQSPAAWRAFLAAFLIFGLVFALLYGTHLQPIERTNFLNTDLGAMGKWASAFSNLRAVFWGVDFPCYGPVWGGLLNPVVGAFFFLGLLSVVRGPGSHIRFWVLYGLAVLLLPGLLSRGTETFRIMFLAPLLMFLSVRGAALVLAGRGPWRFLLLGLLLVGGAGLDAYQLFGRYHQAWGVPSPVWPWVKSSVEYRAFQVLERQRNEAGPGFILTGLRPVDHPTLEMADYPFDLSQNPGLPRAGVPWAAILVRSEYRPFLSNRFPQMRWYALGKDHPWDLMDWLLGVMPLDETRQAALRPWVEANDGFRAMTAEILHCPPWEDPKPVLGKLLSVRDRLGPDPFLWSCYLERTIFYYSVLEKKPGAVAQAIQEDLPKAYPLPQFLRIQKEISNERKTGRGPIS